MDNEVIKDFENKADNTEEKIENKKVTGFGIASLILGILAILTSFTVVLTIIFGIISIILGIVEINKKNKKALAIAGIVCSILGIVISIIWVRFLYYVGSEIDWDELDLDDIDVYDYIQSETIDVISGENWIATGDKSYLVLEDDGTFKYYQSKEDLTNNYYDGTYEVYNGEDAIEYISTELEEYGVTEEEQRDLLYRNSQYSLDNYYCLVLNSERCMMDGVDVFEGKGVSTPYMGFYFEDEEILDMANMRTGTYRYFAKDK